MYEEKEIAERAVTEEKTTGNDVISVSKKEQTEVITSKEEKEDKVNKKKSGVKRC
ncbi:MAG: hypothetical protein WDO16_11390 [Bacteroidota bacterium]